MNACIPRIVLSMKVWSLDAEVHVGLSCVIIDCRVIDILDAERLSCVIIDCRVIDILDAENVCCLHVCRLLIPDYGRKM